jgi:hypothetical protein
MEHDDRALDGLLRELARAPEGDDAFVLRVLSRTRPRPWLRATLTAAAILLFSIAGYVLAPAPSARIDFSRHACLVPEAAAMRVLVKDGDRYLLLGEAPLDAQARVPAGPALLLQAVDANGYARWTSPVELRLRPREVRSAGAGPVVTLDKKDARAPDIKPILDRHCAGCHAESELLASAKPFDARNSALVTQTHAPLPAADRRQLALWVDLGARP